MIGRAYLPSINRAEQTQFSLQFSLEGNDDAVANYAAFFNGGASAAHRPQLVVQYYALRREATGKHRHGEMR